MDKEAVKLFLNIRSRSKVFYNDYCDAVSSTNEVGPFDILPFHVNFICLIGTYLHVWEGENKKVDMKISKGILKVQDNRVLVFLDV
jgi:F0F1-type ATP synthase epsilon subunit